MWSETITGDRFDRRSLRLWEAQDLELLLTYLNDNDLPYTYNHPFWFEFGEQPNLKMVP